jgi:hypothetical protein
MLELPVLFERSFAMRWKDKMKAECVRVTEFLLFPKTIKGETRWLERATWIEKAVLWGNNRGEQWYRWEPIGWEGDEEAEAIYEGNKDSMISIGIEV